MEKVIDFAQKAKGSLEAAIDLLVKKMTDSAVDSHLECADREECSVETMPYCSADAATSPRVLKTIELISPK